MVQEIRSNQQLEQDLDVMDIKIGLLVKNRISVQDVLSTSQQVKHKDKKSHRHSQILEQGSGAGVGGLSKANHEKLEVSGHTPTYKFRQILQVFVSKMFIWVFW